MVYKGPRDRQNIAIVRDFYIQFALVSAFCKINEGECNPSREITNPGKDKTVLEDQETCPVLRTRFSDIASLKAFTQNLIFVSDRDW